MNTFVKVMHANTCNCAACASVPTLGIKMPYEEEEKKATKTRKTRQKLIVGENDLATVAPEIAAMLSEKDKHFAFEVTAGSNRKLTFVCPVCKKEFEAKICSVTIAVCPCPYCRKVKKARRNSKPIVGDYTTTGEDYQSIKVLGKVLLNEYMVPFEFVSILLLVAMIGAVLLSKKEKLEK